MSDDTQTFLTPCELAKLTGQKPQAIYNMIRQGYIKTEDREVVKIQKVIPQDVANEYAAKHAANVEKRASSN